MDACSLQMWGWHNLLRTAVKCEKRLKKREQLDLLWYDVKCESDMTCYSMLLNVRVAWPVAGCC
jgi:hypothetical protein